MIQVYECFTKYQICPNCNYYPEYEKSSEGFYLYHYRFTCPKCGEDSRFAVVKETKKCEYAEEIYGLFKNKKRSKLVNIKRDVEIKRFIDEEEENYKCPKCKRFISMNDSISFCRTCGWRSFKESDFSKDNC